MLRIRKITAKDCRPYLSLLDQLPNCPEVTIEPAVVVWREDNLLLFRDVDQVAHFLRCGRDRLLEDHRLASL